MSSCIHISLSYHGAHPEVHIPGHLNVLEEGVAGQCLGGDGHGLLVTVSPPGGKMALCHYMVISSSSMLGCHVVMGLYGMSAWLSWSDDLILSFQHVKMSWRDDVLMWCDYVRKWCQPPPGDKHVPPGWVLTGQGGGQVKLLPHGGLEESQVDLEISGGVSEVLVVKVLVVEVY